MGAIASQITSLTIVYCTVYSGADQRKHQSSASLAFVRGIHPHKWPVTRKIFPFDYDVMFSRRRWVNCITLSWSCSCVPYDELQPSRWSAEISLSSLAVQTPVTRADTTSQIHHRTTQGIQRGHHMDDWEITREFGDLLLAERNYCLQLIWYGWFSARLQLLQCVSNGFTAVLH